jgi:hypothetical protein
VAPLHMGLQSMWREASNESLAHAQASSEDSRQLSSTILAAITDPSR